MSSLKKLNPEVTNEQFPGLKSPAIERAPAIERVGTISTNKTVEISDTNPHEVFKLHRDPDTFEVTIESDLTIYDYEQTMRLEDFAAMNTEAEELMEHLEEGDVISFFGATKEGGGVAMMRPDLVHLLKLLVAEKSIDVKWYVLEGKFNKDDPNPYDVTKLMHNISQRRLDPDIRLQEHHKNIHRSWGRKNADVLLKQEAVLRSKIVIIDDPQPAPLFQPFKEAIPNAVFLWRNHIDTDHALMSNPETPQAEVADYIMSELGVNQVDAILAHPVESFMHPELESKTYFGPATVSEHDELLHPLSEEEIEDGIAFLNIEIDKKNVELIAEGRNNETQGHIDRDRKRIVLVARFDPAKGMKKAMELGKKTREKMREQGITEEDLPQIIIIGNGATDDPDGVPLYEEKMRAKRENYNDDGKDIIILRPEHNYKAINALMYPTKSSDEEDNSQIVALQMSDAEGCETRITDWILHGVPVMISNRGGMHLQIQEGESGFILDYDKPDHDIERGADIVTGLMTNTTEYMKVRRSTERVATYFNRRDFSTGLNALRWLRIINRTLNGQPADRLWRAKDLTRAV